jgi:NADH dehydrogenase [ubiquinone] 1 alpha subcomplex assembly factor 5
MFSAIIRRSAQPKQFVRYYATTPQAFHVFNRDVKRMQKDRAASNVEQSRTVDYLKDEIAARVADRLLVHFQDRDT